MTIEKISESLVNYIEQNKVKYSISYFESIRTLRELIDTIEKDYRNISTAHTEALYEKMKKWILSESEEELKEHYKWYNVKEGDITDLLNTMFESYCNTYDDEELEKRINDLLEV